VQSRPPDSSITGSGIRSTARSLRQQRVQVSHVVWSGAWHAILGRTDPSAAGACGTATEPTDPEDQIDSYSRDIVVRCRQPCDADASRDVCRYSGFSVARVPGNAVWLTGNPVDDGLDRGNSPASRIKEEAHSRRSADHAEPPPGILDRVELAARVDTDHLHAIGYKEGNNLACEITTMGSEQVAAIRAAAGRYRSRATA